MELPNGERGEITHQVSADGKTDDLANLEVESKSA